MNWFYYFIRKVVNSYLSLKYKISVEGIENIPNDRGFILASNHVYWFDPFLLSMGTKRILRFLAKSELYDQKYFGWFFRVMGIVSVKRGEGSMDAMYECSNVIKEGGVLAIFPEGTRSRGEGFNRPKSGMSVVAQMTTADILPCAIIAPPNVKRGDSIRVIYGKLIPFESLNIDLESKRTLKAATKTVWSEILTLAGETLKNEK